ncbi:hypothetical protein [Ancylobacter sp.]|uniref:hypothetical protein n=1 Tax=Ancylobacter sp. TaxID=1872567 RepID=UPI003D13A10A
MPWKRRSTSVTVDTEVDLVDFDTGTLLQELINRKVISEPAAEKLLARDDTGLRLEPLETDELNVARYELVNGRRGEALVHIERALGPEFIGRLS